MKAASTIEYFVCHENNTCYFWEWTTTQLFHTKKTVIAATRPAATNVASFKSTFTNGAGPLNDDQTFTFADAATYDAPGFCITTCPLDKATTKWNAGATVATAVNKYSTSVTVTKAAIDAANANTSSSTSTGTAAPVKKEWITTSGLWYKYDGTNPTATAVGSETMKQDF